MCCPPSVFARSKLASQLNNNNNNNSNMATDSPPAPAPLVPPRQASSRTSYYSASSSTRINSNSNSTSTAAPPPPRPSRYDYYSSLQQQQNEPPPPQETNYNNNRPTGGGGDEVQYYHQRLTAFMEKYCPERIPMIGAFLEKFKDNEEKMFQLLVQKYGPEPATSSFSFGVRGKVPSSSGSSSDHHLQHPEALRDKVKVFDEDFDEGEEGTGFKQLKMEKKEQDGTMKVITSELCLD